MVRLVGGDDAAELAESGVLKEPVIVTGVVDARRHENRSAPIVVQARLQAEVLDDAVDNALLPLTRTHQLLHGRPSLAEDSLLKIVQSPGLLLKISFDGLRRSEALRYIAGLVLQVENHFVCYALVE